MLEEVVFHHRRKNKKRYLVPHSKIYRIGKALDNDIVLLEADAPPYWGTLRKKDGSYVLENKAGSYRLKDEPYELHGYAISVIQYRRVIQGLIFSLVFSLALMFFQGFNGSKIAIDDRIKLPARGMHGSQTQLISSLGFEFQSVSGKYHVLHYTPGNVKESSELQVLINDQFLSFAPASPGLWNIEQSIYIPKNLIQDGSNHVDYVYSGQTPWAIRNIYIEEMDNEPFQQNEDDLIKNAEKLFRERGAKKGNIVRAEQLLKEAQQLLKRKNVSESEEFKELKAKVVQEKHQMIMDHKILIQKYRRQGEDKKAAKIYKKLMGELIDPLDSDRRNIEEEMRMP